MKKFLNYLVVLAIFCVGTFFYVTDYWCGCSEETCKSFEVVGIFIIAMSACYYYDKIAD